MIQKWIGAALIFVGCSSVGFLAAASCRKEEKLLEQTKRLLDRMECELSCRVSSLPHLCQAAKDCEGAICELYAQLEDELSRQVMPDAASCMEVVLKRHSGLPESVRRIHQMLGQTLGRFDLSGQLQELRAVNAACQDMLSRIRKTREEKMKSYQTLGLCAGAALAILFL